MKRNIFFLLCGIVLLAIGCEDDKKDKPCSGDWDCTDPALPVCEAGVCVARASSMTVGCTDRSDCESIDGWANGSCEDGTCVAKSCKSGYHVCDAADCRAICEKDDIYNCGEHNFACAVEVPEWIDGSCQNAECIPDECNYGFHPHQALGFCEMDDSDNCGEHGFSCAKTVEYWKGGRCVNMSCYARECQDGYFASGGKCYKNGEVVPNPPPITECLDDEHRFGDGCELNSQENCGAHGRKCNGWEVCDSTAGKCKAIPCDHNTSPTKCDAATGYAISCGSSAPYTDVYYLNESEGKCAGENRCIVCPDGFGGCGSDVSVFCKDHGSHVDPPPVSQLPSYCASHSPDVCYEGKIYACSGHEYSESSQCGDSEICVTCENGRKSITSCQTTHAAVYCSSIEMSAANTEGQCIKDHLRCDGKKLMRCDGKSYSILERTCDDYCVDGSYGENSACSSYTKPICTLKEGTLASVIVWNDGDTAVLLPTSDGSCTSERLTVRIVGIDTPECSKQANQSYNYIYTCIRSSDWSATNDPYGYEAWNAAMQIIPPSSLVTVHCPAMDAYGRCTTDKYDRSLIFLSYGSLDFSTEMMKSGYAIPNVRFPALLPQNKSICLAMQNVMTEKKELFSVCNSVDQVCINDAAKRLYSTNEGEFDRVYGNCQYVLKNMPDE